MSASSGESRPRGESAEATLLRTLFPFFLAVDADGRIDAAGGRWASLAPAVQVGARFDDVLEIDRPAGIGRVAEVGHHLHDVFLIAVRDRPQLQLRGQFLPRAAGAGGVFFAGGPWVTRVADMGVLGLEMSDFPPHDPRGDLMLLLQAQESTLADMRQLAATLRARIEHERTLEEQLRQIQKMELVGRFAGGIAHNFNNILMAIHGYAALSLSRLPAGEPVRPWIEQIRSAADHAATLTRQLLTLSRQHPLRLAPLDVSAEFEDLGRLVRPLLGERIALELEVEPGLGEIEGDSAALKQVVMNLVLNARDAMPSGGTVRISVRAAVQGTAAAPRPGVARPTEGPAEGEGLLEIVVTDTGTGMDERTRRKLFEPFFTTKDVGKGVGLGLASVDGLVEQCGGRIEVESELGRGSTFRVLLPRRTVVRRDEGAGRPAHATGAGERILLVEDEPLVRKLLEQFLTRAGYEVSSSMGPEAAIEFVRHGRAFDALVTDVVMPGMGGPQLAARIEESVGPVPTVFMSGHSDDPALQPARLAAHQRYLAKPFAPAQLLATLGDLLAPSRRIV